MLLGPSVNHGSSEAHIIDGLIEAVVVDTINEYSAWSMIPDLLPNILPVTAREIGVTENMIRRMMRSGILTNIRALLAKSVPNESWDVWCVNYDCGALVLQNYGDYRVICWEHQNRSWKKTSMLPEEVVLNMVLVESKECHPKEDPRATIIHWKSTPPDGIMTAQQIQSIISNVNRGSRLDKKQPDKVRSWYDEGRYE